jgi:hypothetical protein
MSEPPHYSLFQKEYTWIVRRQVLVRPIILYRIPLLSIKRPLVEVGHPRIIPLEPVDVYLLKQESISPIPFVIDSHTGYTSP